MSNEYVPLFKQLHDKIDSDPTFAKKAAAEFTKLFDEQLEQWKHLEPLYGLPVRNYNADPFFCQSPISIEPLPPQEELFPLEFVPLPDANALAEVRHGERGMRIDCPWIHDISRSCRQLISSASLSSSRICWTVATWPRKRSNPLINLSALSTDMYSRNLTQESTAACTASDEL